MFIKVKVKPSSGRQYPKHPKGCKPPKGGKGHKEIEKKEDYYLVHLKSPAEDNKANIELLKILQKYFKNKEVKIKSGLTSRNKLIEII